MTRDRIILGARWSAIIGTVAALTFLIFELHRPRSSDALLLIEHARFVEMNSPSPPAEESAWRPVQLPDDWIQREARIRQGWYLIDLQLNVPPDRLWAVYLPSVNMNAAVYLNGELLGNGGRFDDPVARNWNRPLYFGIPNGLLHPGTNTVHIRLKTQAARYGLLGPVYLGPASVLRPIYAQRYFLRYTMSQVIVILLIAIALFMAALWYRRRQDTMYLWFATAMGIWGFHNLNLIAVNILIPARVWDWAMFVSLMWFPIVATLFNHRFLGIHRPRLEAALYASGTIGAAALALAGDNAFYLLGARVIDSMTLAFGLYPVGLLFMHFWRSARFDVLILLMSGLLVVALGTHDLLVVNHVISREDGFFMHYSAPPVLGAFGVILLRRFVDALNESEALNRELEQRIEQKHRELSDNYDRLRTLERERVLTEERGRIMRDMHDGMGGHLVSTLALVEGTRTDPGLVRQALQTALDDLRLMIDSMEDVGGDLLGVLGMLRDRLEPRLRQGGIALRWQVQALPRFPDLGPQKALQVMRILQEAVTNIIKHADASVITVRTATEPDGGAVVEFRDDGRGFDDAATRGRGLANMTRRAEAIQGRVSVTGAADGTCVRLWLPLEGNRPEPSEEPSGARPPTS